MRTSWLLRVAASVLAAAISSPVFAGDDEPVSVPFEEMSEEEAAAHDAREAEYQRAVGLWTAYYRATCNANADHEARLAAWRRAAEAWNKDPSLPSPGPRPELVMPSPPSVARPPAMTTPAC